MKSFSTLKNNILALSSCLLVMLALFFLTNPSQLPAAMLLIAPILIGILTYYLSKLMLSIFSDFSSSLIRSTSLIGASFPTLLVLLGSSGQLGLTDVILASTLTLGLAWYMKRQSLAAN